MPEQKTYLSFGTDLAHVIDVTESLIIGNENLDQNVQLEWEIFFLSVNSVGVIIKTNFVYVLWKDGWAHGS